MQGNNAVNIEKNKVVTIHYSIGEPGKALFEDSRIDGKPLMYLHGQGGIVESLANELEGKSKGDNIQVTLENAYGEHYPEATQRVSINHIVKKGKKKPKLSPGMVVYLNTKDSPRAVTVIKVGLKAVDVDLNHPFAGKTLDYNVDVLDVRDATADELAHGHAHGAGGVEH